MPHVNTSQLIERAVTIGELAQRAHYVQSDPTVRKAWAVAGSDIARTAGSIATAASETGAAWRRSDAGRPLGAHLRIAVPSPQAAAGG
jgi:hypothetical protein